MEIILQVIEKLGPLINKEVELHFNSDQEARTLADNLMKIQMVLEDAERKQLRQPLVKLWLEELQFLAYDIEDTLDDWEARNQAVRQEPRNLIPTKSQKDKVRHFLHYPCSCFIKVVERRAVALDIKGLNDSVMRMYNKGVGQLQLNHLLLTSNDSIDKSESGGSSNLWRRTSSDFVKSEVHGREIDAENVKNLLLSGDVSDNSRENHEVICIVGPGGLGKTTLAKMIYDDDEVKLQFPVRIWVCVSDPFDEFKIAKEIYEQLVEGRSPFGFSTLEALKKEMKKCLREKSLHENSKFLLVLDDVWTEDSEVWKPLYGCLGEGGANGSKILVTTRKDKTAEALGVCKSSIYPLGQMTDEQCWSIICHMALPDRDEADCRRFKKVGLEIAKKCDGLPLAAIFLGGHLKDKEHVRDWERVLKSEVWKLENVQEKLFRHFFLSYDELKPAVKRCFAYCSVFPKDHRINVDDLITIWMAQGFLSSSTTTGGPLGDGTKANGHGYFKDLIQRSFFQPKLERDELKGKSVVYCRMHDIVHDFAQYLSANTRHLWWDQEVQQNNPIPNADKLRSLFYGGGLLMEDIVLRLKCIRALSLAGCQLEKIPDEIGNLIHLRYLNLSDNCMKELPVTICNLSNLQALIIIECWSLSKLPKGISNLRKLRYLFCHPLEYPSEIASLTNLRVLEYLDVSNGFNDLRYLTNLNQLEGLLRIRLREMDDVEAAKTAALWKKTSLDVLFLDYDEGVKLQVVEALRPHPELQTLIIDTSCLRLPSWIPTLENLRNLSIHFTGRGGLQASTNRSSLPPLWKLPSLEYLVIESHVEEWVGNGFYGLINSAINDGEIGALVAFPALRKLELQFDFNWKEWNEMEEEEEAAVISHDLIIMPRLTDLNICQCYKLETLPHRALQKLRTLRTLRIEDCPRLEKKYGDVWTPGFDVVFKN